MTIDHYINELLHKTECVIIPGFGGLITNYQPARINRVQNSFAPPSKNVVFNASLKNNDGLLANYVADAENISYMHAINRINNLVNTMLSQLKDGRIVVLDNIGSFTLNEKGEIKFEAASEINFYENAYGLPTIVSPAIKRTGKQKKIERKLLGREYETHETNRKRLRWAAAIAIPVAAAVIWASSSDISMNSFYTQNSKLIPGILDTQNKQQEHPASEKTFPLNNKAENTVNKISREEPLDKQEPADEKPDNSNPSPQVQLPGSHYHIIAGSFTQKENAEQLADRLFSEGHQVKVLKNSTKGYFRVSMKAFQKKDKALEELMAIRNNNFPNAWLLRE